MEYLGNLFQSKKRAIGFGLAFTFIVLAIFFFWRSRQKTTIDPAFSKFIESYTTGIISKESPIRIRLAGEIATSHVQNDQLPEGVFDFSPSIKGKAFWVDARTIEFKPDGKLDPDKSYTADFKLDKIIKVPSHFDDFKFTFQTIRPDFTVTFYGLQSATNTSTTKMKLDGVVETADNEDNAAVEKVIQLNYPSQVSITWVHNSLTKSHQFTVNQLVRKSNGDTPLAVDWDGSSLNIKKQGSETFQVPAIGDFKVLVINAVQEHEQYIQVMFSDPIRIGQELTGLIGISNSGGTSYAIEGSVVKVYTPERLDGNYSVYVNEGVENISHQKITRTYNANVFFENRLPNVTIPGKGVILPDSGKMALAFEAINLSAVDVSIIKIYENNIPQYFQNNGFDGAEDLRHLGKPVVEKTIRLDADKGLNLNKKNRFMLDIDHLLRAEPGAIYRVIIGFRKEYSLYNCKTGRVVARQGDNVGNDDNTTVSEEGEGDEEDGGGYYGRITGANIDEDDDFWVKYDSYYPAGFKWSEREDPCTDSYYTRERWATRNIIASNIGLIAKRGNDNSMLVAVTNLLSAKPMSGVELELLDYQKQVILKTTSDGDGFAKFILKRKPYLLVAKHGTERGYLKLDDGSSLPFITL